MAKFISRVHDSIEQLRVWLAHYPSWLVELVLASTFMFVIAAIIKRWWRALIPFVLGGIAVLVILQTFGVIHIKHGALPHTEKEFQTLLEWGGSWLHDHPVACVAGVVGFCAGWSLV